jgi:[CysO sulfur-carrier protein]-S-L-cysteine hydrolase
MIRILRAIIDRIAEQARREAPNESCGYLCGVDGEIREQFPLTNVDKSPEHFSLDPREQFTAVKEARNRGLQPVAVYHSHPATPARLSREDLRLANDPATIYVIYSVPRAELRAFSVSAEKTVRDVPVEIV